MIGSKNIQWAGHENKKQVVYQSSLHYPIFNVKTIFGTADFGLRLMCKHVLNKKKIIDVCCVDYIKLCVLNREEYVL